MKASIWGIEENDALGINLVELPMQDFLADYQVWFFFRSILPLGGHELVN